MADSEQFPPPPDEAEESQSVDGEDSESENDEKSQKSEKSDTSTSEPLLKYERIGNDMTSILAKDAASCMAVHTKFLAVGTHWGMIHIMDHIGNNIRNKELPAHTTTVNQISIDDNGDYLASCSDDGRVVINGLYTTDNNQSINYDRPIKAVAMDPNFYRSGSGKHFVTGDDKLVLNEKGFLNRHKTVVLHQGEGPIRNIKWRSSFIAWSNDVGVKVYDMSSRRRITFIAKDETDMRADQYRCNLCWKDERTLLIGWGHSIKVCVVRERALEDMRDLPNRYVEIVGLFNTDFMVCGVAPFGESIIVLSYDDSTDNAEGGKVVGVRPNLRIIDPTIDGFEESTNDALSIRGFEGFRSSDYRLECLIEESEVVYFIVSPKDVVTARQRDQDDHIMFLMQTGAYERAMELATIHSKELKKCTYQFVGREYLTTLMDEGKYKAAAELLRKVIGTDKKAWEDQVYSFAAIHQLRVLSPFVPFENPKMSPHIYEMVMNEFLQNDHNGFAQVVRDWPCDVYNIQTLVNAVLDKIDRDRNNPILLQSLGDLYTHDQRYDKALGIYLRLKHNNVFELIHKHNLFESIADKIVLLLQFNVEDSVKLLLDNVDKIPVDKVVKQLDKHPHLLHVYLDALFRRDPHLGKEHQHLQVRLYAEYDRRRLISFLRSSNYFSLEDALKECTKRELVPEMVFLLGRMGNTKQALRLITHELRDVQQAIDFCKEHNDEELWQDLISFSIDKPSFITGLLRNIGTHVDPIKLIERIQPGMKIPGLRDSLVKIMQDYNLQIALREGCKRIIVADGFALMQRLIRTQRKGMYIDEKQQCHVCRERIIVNNLRFTANVVMFHCHHVFHEDCLPAHAMENCMICSANVRSPGFANST